MPHNNEPSLTTYVAEFIVGARASEIPADAMRLGKRPILGGNAKKKTAPAGKK